MRGIAIVMMIIFHFLYDLNFFGIVKIDVFKGPLGLFGKSIFIIFLLLVGISMVLSSSRRKKEGTYNFLIYLKRGVKIFLWGMVITIITYLVIPEAYVKFGILHLIGISVILSFPFLRFKYTNLIAGIVVITIGLYLQNLTVNTTWLYWLGLTTHMFRAVDHFPIFPYFGIVLIGLFVGKIAYKNFIRSFSLPSIEKNKIIYSICFFGKHSLLIYLVHQPLLIVILYIARYSAQTTLI